MDKFVDAVKSWVQFELILTVVGMIGIIVSGVNASKYLSPGMAMIYGLLFIILLVRMIFLGGVLSAGTEGEVVEGTPKAISDNCTKCNQKITDHEIKNNFCSNCYEPVFIPEKDEEVKCDICNNGSCWKCKKNKKGGN